MSASGKRKHDEPSDPDEELSQRRERGRLAQRAFRQRQINTIRELRETNKAMLDAIDAITRVAVDIDNTALTEAVREARRVAGFDDSLDDDSDPDSLDADGEEDSVGGGGRGGGIMGSHSPSHQYHQYHQHHQGSMSTSPPAQSIFPLGAAGSASPDARQRHHNHNHHSSEQPTDQPNMTFGFRDLQLSSSLSPFLGAASLADLSSAALAPPPESSHAHYHQQQIPTTTAAWLDVPRPATSLDPPQDILPHMSPPDRPPTLSTLIFWATHLASYNRLRALADHDPSDPEALALATRTFGHSLAFEPAQAILNRIHLRLSFRKLGRVDRHHPGNDPAAVARLRQAVLADLAVKGVRLENFVDSDEIERIVTARMGEGGYAASVEAVLAGSGREEDLAAVEQLVARLSRWAFCFGDGPRWRTDHVQRIVEAWMGEFGYPARQGAAPPPPPTTYAQRQPLVGQFT